MTTETTTASGARTTELTRVFKAGSLLLPDRDSTLSAEESLKLHERAYPFVRHATLAPPIVEGDRLVYEVEKRPVETKG